MESITIKIATKNKRLKAPSAVLYRSTLTVVIGERDAGLTDDEVSGRAVELIQQTGRKSAKTDDVRDAVEKYSNLTRKVAAENEGVEALNLMREALTDELFMTPEREHAKSMGWI